MAFVSVPATSLPVVDLTNEVNSLNGSSTMQLQCKCKCKSDKVRRALEEYGCFIVEYKQNLAHIDVGDKMLRGMQDLFNLPLEIKKQTHSDALPLTSYFGQQAASPLHEAIGITQGTALEDIQSFTSLMWPDNRNPNFSQSVYELSKTMQDMGFVVTEMMLRSYQLSEMYTMLRDEQMKFTPRLMYYRVPNPDESCTIGIPRHVDKTFITILHQIQTDGLEVEGKDGKWISVGHSPSSFIVMAGETLLAWTNGRINPPWHRVNMAELGKERYSFGIFTSLKGEIKAPQEMIDEEHPLLFKPYIYEDFMRAYAKGRRPLSLKAYCGIKQLNAE